MNTRRQHYVWRNYLRAWSSHEQIWCIRSNKVFPTNLMNIAQERDFYRLNELTIKDIKIISELINQSNSDMLRKLNHGWIQFFTVIFTLKNNIAEMGVNNKDIQTEIEKQIITLGEQLHNDIENDAIKYIDGLLESNTNFLKDENNVIGFIHYICVQYFRTKSIKESAKKAVKISNILDIEKAWNILSHIFSTSVAMSIYLERSSWNSVILINKTNSPFLTTDQPIINTYSAFGRTVVGADELEFYYPISPQKALLLTQKIEYLEHTTIDLNETEVQCFNDAMIDLSYEQIYSSDQSQLLKLMK